ncbi:MAG: Ig-like domain-containing protein, partial [Leptospira sp.]|nr:Ig-like domain-containing protein [Leptospira sp.]
FSLVPFGTLPTKIIIGSNVHAYYTVTNKYSRTLTGTIESYPKNTTLVTTGDGICSQAFTLGAGQSCRVDLNVTGVVNNFPVLYVCDSTRVNCVGNGNNPLLVTAFTAVSLSITPLNASIAKGSALQYQVTATAADGTTFNVTQNATWSSSNPSIASVSSTGLASGEQIGSAIISASFSGVTASASLSVTAPTVSSITIHPANTTIGDGDSVAYTAFATYSDGSVSNVTSSVTWASSNTTVATISDGGLAHSVAAGTTTISATLGAVTGQTNLTVTGETLENVIVSPASGTIAKGTTLQFQATAYYSDGLTVDVTQSATWSSSSTTTATVQTAGDASPGLAKGVGVGGPITITAVYNGKSGSAALTVSAATLSSIAVTPVSPHVQVGNTQAFTATGTYSDGSTQNITGSVTWSSSNAHVTINSSGLATAVSVGSATITATLGVSGSTTMTVINATLVSIAVTPNGSTFPKGYQQAFTAIGTYSNGTTSDISSVVTWTSNATSVATVNSTTGLVTIVGSSGQATITATSGSISGSAQLFAAPPVLTSISVEPFNITLSNGSSQQYTAYGHYSDGSILDLNQTNPPVWSVSDPTLATVTSAGLATAINSSGTTFVIATVGSIVGSAFLTDTQATVSSVVVSSTRTTVPKGEQQQLVATATYTDSTQQVVTNLATWSSANSSIMTVNNTTSKGLTTAITPGGPINITATYIQSGSLAMTVSGAAPVSLVVTPSSSTLPDGESQPLTATVTFSDGTTRNVTDPSAPNSTAWSSSAPSIISVSNTTGTKGIVTANATSGTATITAIYTQGSDAPVSGDISSCKSRIGLGSRGRYCNSDSYL